MKLKLFIVFIGMLLGSCIYQSFKPEPNWFDVIERSYFEGTALLTYWFMERFFWKD